MSYDPKSAFKSWIEVNLSKSQKTKWCVCFFAIIWSLWEVRNRIIFQKEPFPVDKCMALLWYRWET